MTDHLWSSVQGVPENVGHWASAYGMGGANWLTSGATQEVTVRVDYSYSLDLTQANYDAPYAFVKIYAAFWGPSSNLLLSPDAEWVAEGNYLVKTVRIESAGSSTGSVNGYKTWQVSVTNGAFYSFWGMASSEVWTAGTPISVDPVTWSAIKSLFR